MHIVRPNKTLPKSGSRATGKPPHWPEFTFKGTDQMTSHKLPHTLLGSTALAALVLSGCAATISQEGLEQRTSVTIGRQVGAFTIANKTTETGGRINYTAKTTDGVTYQCYMYSATGFQKAMSFGQPPNSDASCTPMVGKGAAPAAAAGSCNALNKAAGRC